MLMKTHLVIGIAVALYFIPHVNNVLIFIPVVLIASLLPDIDSGFSSLGKHRFFRPVQWTTKHRGIFHSYTLAIFVSLIFAFFVPVLALPFFLGYGFHLLADSFTPNGIRPFWPLKFVSSGVVKSGGGVENAIFVGFVLFDFILAISYLV
jgi:membrane-bound metal-dependent hydrolase YbcI (DUF457 family)